MNKTTKYLFVPFTDENSYFINNYNLCHTTGGLQIYLGDDEFKHSYEDCLFVHFDKTKIHKFDERLAFFKFGDNYLEDYEISPSEHMIIFKIDKSYRTSIESFKKGKYSEMYSTKVIDLFFSKESMDFYLKYKGTPITTSIKKTVIGSGDKQEEIKQLVINNPKVLDYIPSLEAEFKNIVLSKYHVLKKSEELQLILSYLYMVNKKYIDELESKPLMKDEIFNYKE